MLGNSYCSSPTANVGRVRQAIDYLTKKHGYQRTGIVTSKKIADQFSADVVLTFGAARGTNNAQEVDALFVIGTYMPPRLEIVTLASMIFHHRMEPFDPTWSDQDVPYLFVDKDGHGRAYPVPGFWHDSDLNVVLQQLREAEIEQAVHRSRLITRNCDVWLFSPIPLDAHVTSLVSEHELQDAPPGTTIDLWHKVVALAESHFQTGEPIVSPDLVSELHMSPATARRYLELLARTRPDELELGEFTRHQRGRPMRGVRPIQPVNE